MNRLIGIFLLFSSALFGVDYDVAIVGTSPICLLEALYHHFLGKTVLLLEESAECGGAWKSIEICGIPHVDLGCHQIGSDLKTIQFLQKYVNCQFVPAEPEKPHSQSLYFSRGCFELINYLEEMIRNTSIDLQLNQKLEQVEIDLHCQFANLFLKDRVARAKKIYYSPASSFFIGSEKPNPVPSYYYHLYLLIEDSAPPQFSFSFLNKYRIVRAMNLTRFVGLEGTGQQLLVLQMMEESGLANGESILERLKGEKFLSPHARIIKSDSHIYKQHHFHHSQIKNLTPAEQAYFEHVRTSAFTILSQYLPKWTEVFKTYEELIHN